MAGEGQDEPARNFQLVSEGASQPQVLLRGLGHRAHQAPAVPAAGHGRTSWARAARSALAYSEVTKGLRCPRTRPISGSEAPAASRSLASVWRSRCARPGVPAALQWLLTSRVTALLVTGRQGAYAEMNTARVPLAAGRTVR